MTNDQTAAAPEQTASAKKEKKKIRPWIKITLLSILSLFILGLAAGTGYAYYLVKDAPAFNPGAFSDLSATTNVYDRNGELLGSLQSDGNRELIKSLQEVSPHIVNAYLAAEDKDFYNHFGVNPLAILRAVYQNLIGGGIMSGASTITQQTVKNVIFPAQEQTIKRKVQEMYLALQLERVMTKDEILVHYLNWIYFGKAGDTNIYGIKAASKAVFGKDPKELNLAQAALLTAMTNNPSKHSPYTNLDKALEYQEYVLKEMLESGTITQAEYQQARAFDIKASIIKPQATSTRYGNYPFVISEVEQRAAEKLMTVAAYNSLDDARQALFKGGYKVYTTIDRQLQDAVDEVLRNNKNFYANPISYTANNGQQVKDAIQQAGATLLDNKTGAILAVGGGRDFTRDQNNHTILPRQPGSTMKPLSVYGPAAEKKLLAPGSVIDDVPISLANGSAPGGNYFPMNYDRQFHGLITVREALLRSYNIPAIKGTQMVTPAVGLNYVKQMGVTTLQKSDEHLVSGIGGLAYGLTVEEATSAYSTFPNNGVWKESHLIAKIVDRNGKVVYQHTPKETKVFSPQTAYVLVDMMRDVVRKGTASIVGSHFPNRLIAGKTGTTDGTTDSWFIGFTPGITLGIWVGYDIPYPMDRLVDPRGIDARGIRPQLLWNQIMDRVYEKMDVEADGFAPMPNGVVRREVCTKSGKIPTDLCRALGTVTTDLFVQGTEPKEPCDVMVKVKYVEINGKKYLLNDKTAALGGIVKEGIFIKREPYPLPYGDPRYKPWDANLELPKEFEDDKLSASLPAPVGLKVTGTEPTSVSLSWQAVEGASGYMILRSTSPAGPYAVVSDLVNGTAYTDTAVQAGTTYYYQVAAVANGVIQPASGSVQAVPGGAALNAPSGLRAVSSPAGISVSWQPVPGAAQYILYRSLDGNSFEELATLSGTSYQDITASGSNVWYKVAAKNGSVTSPPSAAVKASGGPPPGPAAPSLSIKNRS
ncbi:transglycosylase domain-containing protein [Effusibacillus pohliae]|uniref:transglycosylase domain-containing protein n=1 Tax=Effusibacillus pohliae TaxID=232270 RepID=UPI000369044D|nr:transglycosylase domain-containing protein [Effusibacillus pohliae]